MTREHRNPASTHDMWAAKRRHEDVQRQELHAFFRPGTRAPHPEPKPGTIGARMTPRQHAIVRDPLRANIVPSAADALDGQLRALEAHHTTRARQALGAISDTTEPGIADLLRAIADSHEAQAERYQRARLAVWHDREDRDQ